MIWLSSKTLLLLHSLETCSIESGRRQRVHASSSTSLNLKNSFLVIVILCSNLNKNCLNLLPFVDLYINEKFFPQSVKKIREFVFPVFNTNRFGDTVSIENFVAVFAAHFS